MDDKQAVFVKPAPGESQQSITIGTVRQFIAQYGDKIAPLMFAHPGKAKCTSSELLMIEQGLATTIHCPQRRDIGSLNVELATQVLP